MSSDPSPSGGRLWRGPAAYAPSTPWHPGAALLVTALIVAASFFTAAFLPKLLSLRDGVTGAPHPGRIDVSVAGLWMVATFQALAVALTLLASSVVRGRARDVLALRPAPTGWHAYAGAILAMAGLQVVLAGIQHIFLKHDMLTDLRPFVGMIQGPSWPLAAVVLGLGAPLSEELLFRGFLLGALAKSRLGFWGAAVISTLFWSALHWGYSLTGLAEVFVIGMFLCWLLWRTGSLRVTIFCHALYNSLIVLALRLVDLTG